MYKLKIYGTEIFGLNLLVTLGLPDPTIGQFLFQ